MKKFLLAALFSVLVLCGSVYAQGVRSPIEDMGGGFQTQTLTQESGNKYVLVKFPASYLEGKKEMSQEDFDTGVRITLIKLFGCDLFDKCNPKIQGEDILENGTKYSFIDFGNDKRIVIFLLEATEEDKTVIGISVTITERPKKKIAQDN